MHRETLHMFERRVLKVVQKVRLPHAHIAHDAHAGVFGKRSFRERSNETFEGPPLRVAADAAIMRGAKIRAARVGRLGKRVRRVRDERVDDGAGVRVKTIFGIMRDEAHDDAVEKFRHESWAACMREGRRAGMQRRFSLDLFSQRLAAGCR